MAPSTPNPSSPRRPSNPPPTRREFTGPKASPSPSTPFVAAEYSFNSPTAIQVNRTVSVTVEVSSGSALATHMDVSQYHNPVTTSCYSPSTSTSYEDLDAATEYGTSTSYSSQESYQFTPSGSSGMLSNYNGQSSVNGARGSAEYSYQSSEYYSAPSSQHRQQQDTASTHTFSDISSSRLTMLDRFLAVDSREDALVVEARAAIRGGSVRDENTFAPYLYGWEAVIDSL